MDSLGMLIGACKGSIQLTWLNGDKVSRTRIPGDIASGHPHQLVSVSSHSNYMHCVPSFFSTSPNFPKLTHHQIIQTDLKISSISNIMFIYAECREKKHDSLKQKQKKHGIPTVTSHHPQGGTRNPEPEAVVLNVFVWQLQIWRYVAHRHAWLHSLSPQQRGWKQKGPGGGKDWGVLGEIGVYIYMYIYIYIDIIKKYSRNGCTTQVYYDVSLKNQVPANQW